MSSISHAARPALDAFAPAFTRPTFARFGVLVLASILPVGLRTVSNQLRTVGPLAPGHPSSYRRVLSCRRWGPWRLAYILASLVLARVPKGQLVCLVGDDTVEEYRGKHVHGKARHRDPVRSSHGYTTWRWGHCWVGLAVLVEVPGAARPWALPVLVALCRSREKEGCRDRRHKTPAEIVRQLLLVLVRWFPERTFELAEGCRVQHARRGRLRGHPSGPVDPGG